MVSKTDFDKGLAGLKSELKEFIDQSISQLREQVIDNLIQANLQLQGNVTLLENKVNNLQLELQASFQYNRLNNVVISGIPSNVEHKDLQKAALGIMNTCLEVPITGRDFEACHRISQKSQDVVCRLVNRRDVEEALDNGKKLKNIDNAKVGLPPNTGGLFMNTHLTPYKAKIAYHCRQLKKKGKINKLFTKKGIIKVGYDEKDEGPQWKTISHIDELKELFPDFVFE